MTTVLAERFPRRRNGFYYLDGRRYVSVTTVLQALAKPALVPWAARTVAEAVLEDPEAYDTAERAASVICRKRDAAADRGSLIHSLAEAVARGADIDVTGVPADARGYAEAFLAWARAMRPAPLFTEANVYSDQHGYAGTTDLIAAFPDRQVRLVDFKTTGDLYRETALQLEAYRQADFIVPHVGEPRRIPLPPVAETAAVLLRPDGTYEHRTMRGDLDVFLALLRVWRWMRGKEAA